MNLFDKINVSLINSRNLKYSNKKLSSLSSIVILAILTWASILIYREMKTTSSKLNDIDTSSNLRKLFT